MEVVCEAYLEQENSYQGVEAGLQAQKEAAGAARPLQADDAMAQRPAGEPACARGQHAHAAEAPACVEEAPPYTAAEAAPCHGPTSDGPALRR